MSMIGKSLAHYQITSLIGKGGILKRLYKLSVIRRDGRQSRLSKIEKTGVHSWTVSMDSRPARGESESDGGAEVGMKRIVTSGEKGKEL